MSDQDQTANRNENDLRNLGLVIGLIGIVLMLGGSFYPAMSVIGGLAIAVGVIMLIVWLAVRANKR